MHPMDFMSRKKRIQQRMQDMNISYRQIAQHIMLSVKTIMDWENGKINIPYAYVWKISDLLSLDPSDLMEIM